MVSTRLRAYPIFRRQFLLLASIFRSRNEIPRSRHIRQSVLTQHLSLCFTFSLHCRAYVFQSLNSIPGFLWYWRSVPAVGCNWGAIAIVGKVMYPVSKFRAGVWLLELVDCPIKGVYWYLPFPAFGLTQSYSFKHPFCQR